MLHLMYFSPCIGYLIFFLMYNMRVSYIHMVICFMVLINVSAWTALTNADSAFFKLNIFLYCHICSCLSYNTKWNSHLIFLWGKMNFNNDIKWRKHINQVMRSGLQKLNVKCKPLWRNIKWGFYSINIYSETSTTVSIHKII